MKRDMELIRQILLSVEEHDDVKVDCDDEKLAYHLLLLAEQQFLRGVAVQECLNGPPVVQRTMSYVRLSSKGHDFLDAIRDDSVWKKTREKMATVGGSVTMEVVLAIATKFVLDRLGLTSD